MRKCTITTIIILYVYHYMPGRFRTRVLRSRATTNRNVIGYKACSGVRTRIYTYLYYTKHSVIIIILHFRWKVNQATLAEHYHLGRVARVLVNFFSSQTYRNELIRKHYPHDRDYAIFRENNRHDSTL